MGKKWLVLGLIVLTGLVMGVPAGSAASDDPIGTRYVIGPGDILEISVWKDEALSKQVAVLPDGMISFPLVGEIQASGKTVAALKQEIEEKINRYMPDPVLSVSIIQTSSMFIYVIGRVKGAGRFPVNTNINVLQALSMAGGLDKFASRNKIKIFRESGGKTEIFPFRYDDVVKGKKLEQNIRLKRGDVVVAP